MAYQIKCTLQCSADETWAGNIVELLNRRDKDGYFKSACGHVGYVERSFALQEEGETWEPYLRGAISLGPPDDVYQPFVYLVSYNSDGPVNDLWFAYYKDTRPAGGRLKVGYGPGGPPVLSKQQLISLVAKLLDLGILSREELQST